MRCASFFSMHDDNGESNRRCFCLIILFYYYFFIFWPHRMACGIFVPRPGMEPAAPALEVQTLNPWTTREAPNCTFFLKAEPCQRPVTPKK